MIVKEDIKKDERRFLASVQMLNEEFYQRSNVVKIAKELLGKIIVTYFDEQLTAARIVETEAYQGVVDKASHAYGNRRTKRTEIMYEAGGLAYVYLCYGIHHLFNVVTNVQHTPHAILIRAAQPVFGEEIMMQRTAKKIADNTLTRGPGNVSKALGIYTWHTGINLRSNELFIAADKIRIQKKQIIITPRIGVQYAAEDALLPYRFFLKDNPYVSGKKLFK